MRMLFKNSSSNSIQSLKDDERVGDVLCCTDERSLSITHHFSTTPCASCDRSKHQANFGSERSLQKLAYSRPGGTGPGHAVTSDRSETFVGLLLSNQSQRLELLAYSHSIVPGGLLVISSTTRFTPFTSFTIRLEMVSIRS